MPNARKELKEDYGIEVSPAEAVYQMQDLLKQNGHTVERVLLDINADIIYAHVR